MDRNQPLSGSRFVTIIALLVLAVVALSYVVTVTQTTVAVMVWLLVALIGFLVSVTTMMVMRYEISTHPAALRSPGVAAMKRHNLMAESTRGFAQFIAVLLGLGVALGVLQGPVVAWGLVLMNLALVMNSANELVLTMRLLGRWRPALLHTVSRGPSRPAAVQVDPHPTDTENAS